MITALRLELLIIIFACKYTNLDKLYFHESSINDWLSFTSYGLLFFFLLLLIAKLYKISERKNIVLMSLFFFAYHVLFYADSLVNFLPYLPDSDKYYKLFQSGQKLAFIDSSLQGYFYLSKALSWLFIQNILVYVSFQITLFFLAILTILKAWELQQPVSSGQRNWFLFIALILPSGILFSLVPLRESLTIFAFSVALYGLVAMIKYLKNVNWQFITGLFMVFFSRAQVIVYFVFSLVGLKWLFEKNWSKKILVALFGLITLIAFVNVTHHKISVRKLGIARNIRVNLYNNTYGNVKWDNVVDLAIDAPLLVSQFLLSPLPILHSKNPLSMTLMFLDGMLVLVLFIFFLANFHHIIRKHKVWLILIGIYLLLYGIYEFNIGGAVRHRIPIVLMLIALNAHYLQLFYSKLTNERTSTSALSTEQ